MTCKECINYDVCSTQSVNCNRANHCSMFKNKVQYIKLPCKVGDTVYVIDDRRGIIKCIVNDIHLGLAQEIHGDLFYYEQIADELPELIDVFDFEKNDFDKTVFLTKESAEKALRERESNDK